MGRALPIRLAAFRMNQCPLRKQSRHFHRLPPPLLRPHPTFRKPLTLPHTTFRLASTSQEAVTEARSLATRIKNLLFGTSIALTLWFGYLYVTDVRAGIHQWAVVPSLRWVYDDAEEAHEAGTEWMKGLYNWGVHPRERGNGDRKGDLSVEVQDGALQKLYSRERQCGAENYTQVFGHTLTNPIGTSAGIDKHAAIPTPLFALGPSIVEIGGCTPFPQDGNPKPRVFRVPSQKGMINRYGLNSEGADNVAMRLRQRVREYAYAMGFGIDEEAEQRVLDGEAGVPSGSLIPGKLLAVQVAKNSFTPDGDIEAVKADYVYCVDAVGRYADIIVVNVSSPNTPGLRGLQRVEPLTNILTGVVDAAKKATKKTKPSVMVKVSPDEDSEEQVRGICDAVWESGIDGVIVGNTTKRRQDLLPAGQSVSEKEAKVLLELGGYSGPQLFERTVALTRRYRAMLDQGPEEKEKSPSTTKEPSLSEDLESRIEATTARDAQNLKPGTPEPTASSKSQPLIRLPARNNPLSSDDSPSTSEKPAISADRHIRQIPRLPSAKRKVIFATGGITNGKEALEVLEAGASVAQVYTALVYGGVGTIARIKDEMREEMKIAVQQRG